MVDTVTLGSALAGLVPTPVADIDFAAGTATVSGSPVTLADQFASDSNWSNFSSGDIDADVGYVGPSGGGGGKFAGALLTLMQGLTSYVVMLEYNPKTAASIEFDMYEDPGFSDELHFGGGTVATQMDQSGAPKPNRANFLAGKGTNVNDIIDNDLSRMALMVTPDIFAGSFIGSGVAVLPRIADAIDTWTFVVGEGAVCRRIAIFEDVTDLTTLQMIAALGV